MQINSLKINGFGKLKDKQIDFNNGINIVHGKNEAGKSTVLKFITGMFYGLSKNKNGQNIPDSEKYEPWNTEEFSGRISYELDNGSKYEVYRDFKKKNPKIFNENLEDISKTFNIDKTKGNQFFYDQIEIEEDIFNSSIITKQAEVKLNEKEQNGLIQKISNILGTGEDNSSYTQVVTKLKKKLNDEVGTSNTKERPINLVENRISELENTKKELLSYEDSKFDIDNKIEEVKYQINKKSEELNQLRQANLQKESLKEKENLITINENIANDIQEQISTLKAEEKENRNLKKNAPNKVLPAIISIVIIALVILSILINTIIIKSVIICITIVLFLLLAIMYIKRKKEINKIKNINRETKNKIRILENNLIPKKEEIKKLQKEYEAQINEIKEQYNINNLNSILQNIDNTQNELNQDNIKLHTLEIDKNNVIPKLEKLVNVEEELEALKEEKQELELKRENIKRTLEYLEIAYNKMKEQITPKFTEELSRAIDQISDGKYKNVRINTNGEIIVETQNGEYINAENLSVGTIDQLYLSLRIAAIKEVTKENMPIILDEAFAYYDDIRIGNILKYLSEQYKNKQVIIFTCTQREKECLEKNNIQYNLIEL